MIDLTNQRFGRLTAIKTADKYQRAWRWQCQCDCGQTTVVSIADLRRGKTKSCGCWQRDASIVHNTIHGASGQGKQTAEYTTWVNIMQRCYNPNYNQYEDYGGRDIKVCDRWHNFVNFLADMGLRPAGRYSIERVNVNGDYEPSNCIWLPLREQNKNKRKTRSD